MRRRCDGLEFEQHEKMKIFSHLYGDAYHPINFRKETWHCHSVRFKHLEAQYIVKNMVLFIQLCQDVLYFGCKGPIFVR